jgi:hypothetical protein
MNRSKRKGGNHISNDWRGTEKREERKEVLQRNKEEAERIDESTE